MFQEEVSSNIQKVYFWRYAIEIQIWANQFVCSLQDTFGTNPIKDLHKLSEWFISNTLENVPGLE